MSSAGNLFSKGLRALFGKSSTVVKNEARFIGKDKFGNIYFEIDKPQNTKRPVQRFFNRDSIDPNKDLVDYAHVPPAWDAWLRFRRKEPPSDLEIDESEEYYKMQQELALRRKQDDQAANAKNNKSSPGLEQPKVFKRSTSKFTFPIDPKKEANN